MSRTLVDNAKVQQLDLKTTGKHNNDYGQPEPLHSGDGPAGNYNDVEFGSR
jgi:hypothetical protein